MKKNYKYFLSAWGKAIQELINYHGHKPIVIKQDKLFKMPFGRLRTLI